MQTNNNNVSSQDSSHQEDQGSNSQTSGEVNGQQDADGEGARIHLGAYDNASNMNNSGVSNIIHSNQQMPGISMALLHRHRITMALAMEWKDTPLLLLSLPLLDLPSHSSSTLLQS